MAFALYEMTEYKVRGKERASEGWMMLGRMVPLWE